MKTTPVYVIELDVTGPKITCGKGENFTGVATLFLSQLCQPNGPLGIPPSTNDDGHFCA